MHRPRQLHSHIAPDTRNFDRDRSALRRHIIARDVVQSYDACHPPIIVPVGERSFVGVIAINNTQSEELRGSLSCHVLPRTTAALA
jgi:hypothetical protein